MLRYLVIRVGSSLLTILLVSVLVFLLIHLVPGNAASVILGNRATPYRLSQLRQVLGLNEPLPVQYLQFWQGIFNGTFGTSLVYRVPVFGLIIERLPVTLFLIVYSSVLSLLISLPVGTLAGLNRDRLLDHTIRITLLVQVSIPAFWAGTLLILLLSLKVPLFPVAGYGTGLLGHIHSLFLPALTLSLGQIALLARDLRSSVIDVVRSPYVDFAYLKGLSGSRVLLAHVLRTSIGNTVTLVGLYVGFLLAGAVVVETVFSIPGTGNLLVTSVFSRDYPVVQAITFVYAVLVIVINFVTDLVYRVVDPRVRIA